MPSGLFGEKCDLRGLLTLGLHQLCPVHPPPIIFLRLIRSSKVGISLEHTPNSITAKTYLKSRSQQHRTGVLHVPSSWLVVTGPFLSSPVTYIYFSGHNHLEQSSISIRGKKNPTTNLEVLKCLLLLGSPLGLPLPFSEAKHEIR